MRPLLRPVASSSWSWPNVKRCHSMLTQRLCFSGTDEPKAMPQTMSPQSMVCSGGSPAVGITGPPWLFWRDRWRGLEALVPSSPWLIELQAKTGRTRGVFFSESLLCHRWSYVISGACLANDTQNPRKFGPKLTTKKTKPKNDCRAKSSPSVKCWAWDTKRGLV